eukprot:2167518-Rhodomonas_salina.1
MAVMTIYYAAYCIDAYYSSKAKIEQIIAAVHLNKWFTLLKMVLRGNTLRKPCHIKRRLDTGGAHVLTRGNRRPARPMSGGELPPCAKNRPVSRLQQGSGRQPEISPENPRPHRCRQPHKPRDCSRWHCEWRWCSCWRPSMREGAAAGAPGSWFATCASAAPRQGPARMQLQSAPAAAETRPRTWTRSRGQ